METTEQHQDNEITPDKVKMWDLEGDLQRLAVKYSFESDANQKTYNEVKALINKAVNHIIIREIRQ